MKDEQLPPSKPMPSIQQYYPELIRLLLGCGEGQVPEVFVVNDEAFDKEELFPDNSDFHHVSFGQWVDLGRNISLEADEKMEQENGLNELKNQLHSANHVCLFLQALSSMYNIGRTKTFNLRRELFLNPLKQIFSLLQPGSKLLIPVPIRFLKAEDCEEIMRMILPEGRLIVIEHDHADAAVPIDMDGPYDHNRFATLIIEKAPGPTTLVRIDENRADTIEAFKARMNSILKNPDSKTPHSITLQGLEALRYPPLLRYHDEGIRNPDDLPKLSTFAEVIRGDETVKPDENGGTLCVNAECVTPELLIASKNAVRCATTASTQRFQRGDVCLRSQTNTEGELELVGVSDAHVGLCFDSSFLVVRLKIGQPETRRNLLRVYIGSRAAAKFLFPDGTSSVQDIAPKFLEDLPVPTSEEVEIVFAEIDQARQDFENWSDEAGRAVDDLLLEEETHGIRDRVLQIGKSLREMHIAAKRTQDLDYRIIHQYPRPLSFVWADYRASLRENAKAPYECIAKVRKAAETLISYLALLAASQSHSQGGDPFKGWRVSHGKEGKKGLDFGSWAEVLKNSCLAMAKSTHLSQMIPEFSSMMADKEWEESLTHLFILRNDDAHLRIPHVELLGRVREAENHLRQLFEKAGFLTDYSLRVADFVKWDSHSKVSEVEFREIHGATVYSASSTEKVPGLCIESGSLYLVNRLGVAQWHLLSPFFLFERDESYKLESVFHLDGIDRGNPGKYVLKSFEFNSTRSTAGCNDLFEITGMIKK